MFYKICLKYFWLLILFICVAFVNREPSTDKLVSYYIEENFKKNSETIIKFKDGNYYIYSIAYSKDETYKLFSYGNFEIKEVSKKSYLFLDDSINYQPSIILNPTFYNKAELKDSLQLDFEYDFLDSKFMEIHLFKGNDTSIIYNGVGKINLKSYKFKNKGYDSLKILFSLTYISPSYYTLYSNVLPLNLNQGNYINIKLESKYRSFKKQPLVFYNYNNDTGLLVKKRLFLNSFYGQKFIRISPKFFNKYYRNKIIE